MTSVMERMRAKLGGEVLAVPAQGGRGDYQRVPLTIMYGKKGMRIVTARTPGGSYYALVANDPATDEEAEAKRKLRAAGSGAYVGDEDKLREWREKTCDAILCVWNHLNYNAADHQAHCLGFFEAKPGKDIMKDGGQGKMSGGGKNTGLVFWNPRDLEGDARGYLNLSFRPTNQTGDSEPQPTREAGEPEGDGPPASNDDIPF